MKSSTIKRPLSMVKCGTLACWLLLLCCPIVDAQNTIYYGQGFFGFGANRTPSVQPAVNDMGKNVLALDNLVTEIKWRCGRELQKNRNSRELQALYAEMKGLGDISEALLLAYQTQNRPAFVASVKNFQLSLARVETLQKKATLPPPISSLIQQSKPMVTFVAGQAETYQMVR